MVVDRPWPRSVSRNKASREPRLPEVPPGHALREWFDHDPARFGPSQEPRRTACAVPVGGTTLQSSVRVAEGRPPVLPVAAADPAQHHAVAHLYLLVGGVAAPR